MDIKVSQKESMMQPGGAVDVYGHIAPGQQFLGSAIGDHPGVGMECRHSLGNTGFVSRMRFYDQ